MTDTDRKAALEAIIYAADEPATIEQLALALDPYPRAPGAELPEIEAEPEAHQFAALGALKRPN